MADERMQFTIEDAQILYRNFSGNKTTFNALGQRNFCVVLDDKTAAEMEKDGWYIRTREPREEGDEPLRFIQIKVNFESSKPPRIILVSSAGHTPLNADTVGMLDYTDIATVDLTAVSFNWEVRGETGITAYLRKLYVVQDEDELDRKYAIHPSA